MIQGLIVLCLDLLVSKPVLHRSNRISKLPKHLKDYEITFNCTSIKYPIHVLCGNTSGLSSDYMRLMISLNKIKELEYVRV